VARTKRSLEEDDDGDEEDHFEVVPVPTEEDVLVDLSSFSLGSSEASASLLMMMMMRQRRRQMSSEEEDASSSWMMDYFTVPHGGLYVVQSLT